MKLLVVTVGTAIFLTTLQVSQAKEKIKVGVYYEALCRYSQRFIVEQLAPNYDQLSQYASFEFRPCGKADCTRNAAGVSECSCQHGPVECSQNRIQGCALDALSGDEESQVKFVGCAMTQFAASYKPCCNLVGLNYETIAACGSGLQGREIMARQCGLSEQLISQTNSVPTVRFNDKYSALKHSDALADLPNAIERERDGFYAKLEKSGFALFTLLAKINLLTRTN